MSTSIVVPVIESARLRLRGHHLDDFDDCVEMWSDPLVTRYIGGKPFSRQQTWMRVLAYAGHWAHMGFGYWAIEERASGRYIGELGFADFRRDIDASMQNVPELGWALSRRAQGNGFATEAVLAALEWSDAHLEFRRTVCLIGPENLASIRVAEKGGYREFERARFGGEAALFFERNVPRD